VAAAFSPLLDMLAEVPDPRRAEGKLYTLPHVLLFSILAIVSGCNSYRGIVTFIDVHRYKLNAALLQAAGETPGTSSIALDGKTLRGSFDKFHDRAAAQVLQGHSVLP